MAIYLSSDWHLIKKDKETGLIYVKPDFEEIICSQYQTVNNEDDLFIFMGDMFDDDVVKTSSELWDILGETRMNMIRNLHGKKIFIRGNNDIMSDQFYIERLGFSSVKFAFTLEKSKVIISHTSLPIHTRTGWINIHGHIHRDGWNVDEVPYYHNAERCINICNRGCKTFSYADIDFKTELARNNKTCSGMEKPFAAYIQNQAMSYFRKALAQKSEDDKFEKSI